MGRPNYAFAKHQREIAKKQKKEAKRQRKAELLQDKTAPGMPLPTAATPASLPPPAQP